MFTLTRELYHTEMAAAVYEHLREFLLTKENNHCQRVEFLPAEVMHMTCQMLRSDSALQAHRVDAYVLAQQANQEYEIESGALIEKRNRENFGVLVAFIPQGLRLPAEDSYDIQTFKTYDLSGVLRAHTRRMIEALPEDGQGIARTVLSQPAARRLPTDHHLKYLLALTHDGAGWQEAGAYLFYLNLLPDLELSEKGLETRIDRNSYCVAELSNADRSTLSGIEALVNEFGLDPEENNLRENLVAFLRDRNVVDTDRWLAEILTDAAWRSKLTFDKWKFKDLTKPGEIEVHLTPLEDPKTGALAKGIKKEGSNLVATTDPKSPITLKWSTYPKKPDNLGHYLIMVVRDTDDEEIGEELLRKTVKGGRTSLKLSLKDIELDEGETCSARIIIRAKDGSGVILDSDESESFWVEGGIQIEETVKKVNKVRNRAEAFFQAALKYRKPVEVDSEGWEEGRQRMYRIKLKSRDIYRIVINSILYGIELKNIIDPLSCGAWQADMRNRAMLEAEDLRPVEVSAPHIDSFDDFTKARKQLFKSFQEKDPVGVIEAFDLREFKDEIMQYVTAYRQMYEGISNKLQAATSDGQINNILNAGHHLSRIDTIHLNIGTPEDESQLVILAPTHPLRMLWVLQYQQLLDDWSEKLDGLSEEEASKIVNRESVDKITSLNIPSALAFAEDEIYINSDNVNVYWSIFPKGGTPDVRKVVSLLLRLLGQKEGGGDITSITPTQIADKIWRYLKHHPYIRTLQLNVINPGDGLIILNAIREIQKTEEFKDLNYDIAFYGDLGYEVMGSAFDELMEETNLAEGRRADVDEELLQPNKNSLFPKLIFSKQRVPETEWKKTLLREAHVTILIDRFSTKVLTRPTGNTAGSFCLHNLLAEYRSDFDLKGESATWSRKVVPNCNGELLSGDNCAENIFKLADLLLRVGASFYDWGNSLDKVPAIQLELSDTDKHIVSQIHERSDWVFTIDRNFGVEYFDNPTSAPGASVRSYLIDYTPEFLDGVGHRLIISTFWLSEIEGFIQEGLKKMGIPGTGFHAAQILDVLKSISGRLALKLINNPNDAREIIGLSLTRLLLEQEGALSDGVLIPVDSHLDLFMEHRRQFAYIDLTIHRSDLILAHIKDNKLVLKLIEVKFRSGAGSLAEEYGLKEAIVAKNADTRRVLESKFFPKQGHDRLDQEINNKQLANLLQFYFDRCQRHGLIIPTSAEALLLQDEIKRVEQGNFNLEFEKAGYIFNLQGASKPSEIFNDNEIFVIGRDKIRELLDIHDDIEVGSVSLDLNPDYTSSPAKLDTGTPKIPQVDQTSSDVTATVPEQEMSERTSSTQEVQPPNALPLSVSEGDLISSVQSKKEAAVPDTSSPVHILLGRDCDSGRNVYWDPFTATPKKLTNQHILIVGKSGTGKTQTTSSFLWQLSKAIIPAVIFDFQGEYISDKLVNADGQTFLECTKARVLDASDGIDVNPLEVPLDPHSGKKQNYMKVVYQVAASLAKIFGLGDIQHSILRDAIGQAFVLNGFIIGNKETWNNIPPTLEKVWDILHHKEINEGGNVRNLNLRIKPLFETGVFIGSAESEGFEDILKITTIIRLSNLATPELMVAVSRFVLQKIYSYMLAQGPSNGLRVFAVIDEAHKLSYEETLTELIREARKYGVGILLASQSGKDFDRIVFDMVGTKIALQLEGEDAKVMGDNLGLINKSERDIARELILNQPPHRALVRSNHFEPYIQIDVLPFWKMKS